MRLPPVVACVAVSLLALGCADASDGVTGAEAQSSTIGNVIPSSEAPTTSDVPSSERSTSLEPVSVVEALDWTAPLIGGGSITMSDYAGQQVLLWFWAPY